MITTEKALNCFLHYYFSKTSTPISTYQAMKTIILIDAFYAGYKGKKLISEPIQSIQLIDDSKRKHIKTHHPILPSFYFLIKDRSIKEFYEPLYPINPEHYDEYEYIKGLTETIADGFVLNQDNLFVASYTNQFFSTIHRDILEQYLEHSIASVFSSIINRNRNFYQAQGV